MLLRKVHRMIGDIIIIDDIRGLGVPPTTIMVQDSTEFNLECG